jgi:hypothetical protein
LPNLITVSFKKVTPEEIERYNRRKGNKSGSNVSNLRMRDTSCGSNNSQPAGNAGLKPHNRVFSIEMIESGGNSSAAN